MLDKLKEYAIVALVSILATVGVYTYILNNIKARDAEQIAKLAGQIQILDRLSQEQDAKNKILAKNVEDSTKLAKTAHDNTEQALAMLDKLKKPVVIDKVDTIEEVKSNIAEYYNDNTTTFDNVSNRFGILKSTMFNLTDDAIEWKINGPILNAQLKSSTDVINSFKVEVKTKDQLILDQQFRIGGLNTSLDLCNQKEAKKDETIVLLTRDLKIEGMNGKIKLGIGLAAGAGTYYIVDRLRKK